MNWREIRILYGRELRSALRERSIVVNSILMPILLYPVMLWAVFAGITLVEGMSEGFTSRVAVYGLPAEHGAIRDSLAALEKVELAESPPAADVAGAALRAGELDAVVTIEPASGAAAALEGNFVARIRYDQSEERSRRAMGRVQGVVDAYRSEWLERESEALRIPPEELAQFRVERVNTSSGSEMGAFVLSLLIPFMLVIMVALGCFYPAIDATAGERERSTWETLMSVSASRTSVLVAKYLYVTTLGTLAGILNVIAMVITVGAILGPLLAGAGENVQFAIPALAVPLMLLGAMGLALLFAAMMLILAAFARTFKDGQAMITPAYYLAIIPGLFVVEPDLQLDATLAAIPIANVMLMIRDAFQGTFQWLYIGETMVMVVVLVVLCLALARYILKFEDLMLGSYDGNFWKFIRERGLKRARPASERT
jgi:ABC-type Na+ efflux pump permease subunit